MTERDANLVANGIPVTATRYPELGLAKVAGHIWRWVARESSGAAFDPYSGCIGSSYRTKGEALADLDRFASDYGATGAHKPEHLRYTPINGAWSTGRPCPVCAAETGQPCIDGHVHAGRETPGTFTAADGTVRCGRCTNIRCNCAAASEVQTCIICCEELQTVCTQCVPQMRMKYAVLVYQAGIANVFQVTSLNLSDYGRDARRLLQSDFRTCESFARGLAAAGVCVRTAACNMAGDIVGQTWSENLEDQPFSDQFHPVHSGAGRSGFVDCRCVPRGAT